MVAVTVKAESGKIVADVATWPGSPAVGRGDTIYEALGRWLHANRGAVGVEIVLDMSAFDQEMERRLEELGSR